MEVCNFQEFQTKAYALGFDAVGIAPVDILPEEKEHLLRWLEKGYQADMTYMERNIGLRENPALLVEGVRSVIVTLTNYYTTCKQPSGVPVIARYAYGKDYHLVVKERLRKLMEGMEGRCFTDSAPVFEHEWARRAGLGWIGKNTLLIHKSLGSFCFIGVMMTSAVFDSYSRPFERDFCGRCTRCVDACPTGALSEHQLDAQKCISYQTIENKGEYPEELKVLSGNRIFGCDVCQEACPWNAHAPENTVADFALDPAVSGLTAEAWRNMEVADFKRMFKGTPLERTGLDRVLRNIIL